MANSNVFVTESFVDELAHAAGRTRWRFAWRCSKPNTRPRVVLERAAKLANWGAPLAAGRAHGVALGQWNGSWIALVAEISMPNGKLKVDRMSHRWMSASRSTSTALNSRCTSADALRAVGGLTGKITFADGGAVQKNFTDYTVLRMTDSPQFAIDIVPSHETSTRRGRNRNAVRRAGGGQRGVRADRQAGARASPE